MELKEKAEMIRASLIAKSLDYIASPPSWLAALGSEAYNAEIAWHHANIASLSSPRIATTPDSDYTYWAA